MSFQLPAGASLDEDLGDLVIKDSLGAIILRYDEGTSEWQFQSEALTGISSLTTEALATSQGTVWDRDGAADFIDRWAVGLTSNPTNTTSTSYVDVADLSGIAVDFSKAPAGATLYGRVLQRFSSNHASDAASTVVQVISSGGAATNLTELEQSVADTGSTIVDTGWTEITSISSGVHGGAGLLAKAAGSAEYESVASPGPGIWFGWRLD